MRQEEKKKGRPHPILEVFNRFRPDNPEKSTSGTENGPAAINLRKGGIRFQREPANICTPRNVFFLNRVVPLWNELPQKVKEPKTLDVFKAGIYKEKLFKI